VAGISQKATLSIAVSVLFLATTTFAYATHGSRETWTMRGAGMAVSGAIVATGSTYRSIKTVPHGYGLTLVGGGAMPMANGSRQCRLRGPNRTRAEGEGKMICP
jgi:hypothetical protein